MTFDMIWITKTKSKYILLDFLKFFLFELIKTQRCTGFPTNEQISYNKTFRYHSLKELFLPQRLDLN